MRFYLESERLILRRLTPDDLEDLVALDADPDLMRYINDGVPTPRDEMRDDYLPHWLAYYERGDAWGFWAAIERSTGAFLGWFHLRPRPEDPLSGRAGSRLPASRIDLGEGLRDRGQPRTHRQGVRGSRGAPGPCLDDGGQRGLVAGHGEGRHAVCRAFHAEWPVRIEGDEHGDVEYAITRDEWLASKGGTDG